MNFISLSYDELDIGNLFSLAVHPQAGAVSSFVGTTRDNFDGKEVSGLSYEAYDEMAIAEMEKICEEVLLRWQVVLFFTFIQIRQRWDVRKIVIQHKLGDCPVEHPSICIFISSPHRKDSLQGPYSLNVQNFCFIGIS